MSLRFLTLCNVLTGEVIVNEYAYGLNKVELKWNKY